MTCKDLVEFILEYETGTLPEEQLAIFEKHLAKCPPCLRYLETYRTTINLEKLAFNCGCGGSQPSAPSSPTGKPTFEPIPEALVQAILATKRQAQAESAQKQNPGSNEPH